MPHERQQIGALGEQLAAAFLEQRGFRVVARNFRVRVGEVDLIVERGGERHFVEVKTRRTDFAGDPLEQLTPRKQQQIVRAAQWYRHRHPTTATCHFSVLGIDLSSGRPAIEWVPDAFEADDGAL
ncbi:MAG: YraN family protein [Deltaproteobacteria bacterium]|nr:YraN family protein [Deltaproteobacteria bacterium]